MKFEQPNLNGRHEKDLHAGEKEEMLEYSRSVYVPYPAKPIGEAGFSYQLNGVAHIPDTIISFYDDIENSVEQSSGVILEYFDSRNLVNQDIEKQAANIASATGDTKTVVEQNLFQNRHGDLGANFFAAVGGISARHDKDIFVLNPQTDDAMRFTGLVGQQGLFGGGVTLGAVAALLATEATRSDEPMTRRDFLRRSALAGTAVVGGAAYLQHTDREKAEAAFMRNREGELNEVIDRLEQMERVGLSESNDTVEVKLEKLQKCVLDWRDITTALGIVQMAAHDASLEEDDPSRYAASNKPLTHFEGALHVGVLYYLDNIEEARERLDIYNRTFNLRGDMSIRRFRYDSEKEHFNIVSEDQIQT